MGYLLTANVSASEWVKQNWKLQSSSIHRGNSLINKNQQLQSCPSRIAAVGGTSPHPKPGDGERGGGNGGSPPSAGRGEEIRWWRWVCIAFLCRKCNLAN